MKRYLLLREVYLTQSVGCRLLLIQLKLFVNQSGPALRIAHLGFLITSGYLNCTCLQRKFFLWTKNPLILFLQKLIGPFNAIHCSQQPVQLLFTVPQWGKQQILVRSHSLPLSQTSNVFVYNGACLCFMVLWSFPLKC